MQSGQNPQQQMRSPFHDMNPWQLGALGGAGAAMGYGMFNNQNPADSAMPYFNQIPDTMKQQYQPYINAGQQSMSQLQGQYGDLLNNPGGKLNSIGSGYQQSPGFQFALKQALQSTNHGAAAGGMFGSPQHDFQNMDVATGLANQDFGNWMHNALGLYGQGLTGQNDFSHMGFNASNELSQSLAQNLMNQGGLAFQGQANQNQNQSDIFGSLGNLGMLAAFL